MADPIEELLVRLAQNQRVRKTRFRDNFLNNVAEVYGREGPGAAKVFLANRLGRGDQLRSQAETLLEIVLPELEGVEQIRRKRTIGAYVIKALNALQLMKKEEKK
jgi:hypothetical protein